MNNHSQLLNLKYLIKISAVLFCISFLFLAYAQEVKASWLTDWSSRKKITISHTNVDADLTDFPLLVKITSDSDLSTALSTGNDIRFTTTNGTTLLKYFELRN